MSITKELQCFENNLTKCITFLFSLGKILTVDKQVLRKKLDIVSYWAHL